MEIDADNDLQKILVDDAYDQEIENGFVESVVVTDDDGNEVVNSSDINDFTVVETDDVIDYAKYDYVRFQQFYDYCTKEIEGEFDPKKLVFTKYKLLLPYGEEEATSFEYILNDEDEYENYFEHGEGDIECDVYYKKIDGEYEDFDPSDEDEI